MIPQPDMPDGALAGIRVLDFGRYIAGPYCAALTGKPGRPYRTPVQYVDIGTATASAHGVLAALLARERTGRGQWVDASLLRTGNGNGLLGEHTADILSRHHGWPSAS